MNNYRIVINYMQASVYLPEIQYFKHLKSIFLNIYKCAWNLVSQIQSHTKIGWSGKNFCKKDIVMHVQCKGLNDITYVAITLYTKLPYILYPHTKFSRI